MSMSLTEPRPFSWTDCVTVIGEILPGVHDTQGHVYYVDHEGTRVACPIYSREFLVSKGFPVEYLGSCAEGVPGHEGYFVFWD